MEDDLKCLHLNTENLLEEARRSVTSGNMTRALKYYRKAAKADPGICDAWAGMANAHRALGRFRAFVRCRRREISLVVKGSRYAPLIELGMELWHHGDRGKALECFTESIADTPGNGSAWFRTAVALEELGRFHEALVYIDRSLQLRPDYGKAWLEKGRILRELDDLAPAMDALDRAIKLDKSGFDYLNTRGDICVRLGDLQGAEQNYLEALKDRPKAIYIMRELARVRERLGNDHDALSIYNRILQIMPNTEDVNISKAGILIRKGAFSEALDCYELVLKSDPYNLKAIDGRQDMKKRLSGNVQIEKTAPEKAAPKKKEASK